MKKKIALIFGITGQDGSYLAEFLLNKNYQVSFLMLQRFAEMIRVSDERIMDLSTLRAVQRVYIELLRRTDKDIAVPELWVIRPMPSHSLIASLASMEVSMHIFYRYFICIIFNHDCLLDNS